MPSSNPLETYIKELKQIHYLISSMQNSTDLKELLNSILQECIDITKATSGSIMLKHTQSRRLFFCAHQGIEQEVIDKTHMFIGDGIAGTVISDGIPKIINNIHLDPKYITINSYVHSEIAVPIKVKNEIFGVIILDHEKTDAFTDKHLELIQMICNYTGFIISHHITSSIADNNEKQYHLLEYFINNDMAEKDIFQVLHKQLNASGSCILESNGTILFQEGKMIDSLSHLSDTTFNDNNHVLLLNQENSEKIPYTRIIIPSINKNMLFITDKIYYFLDNIDIDIKIANIFLTLLTKKQSSIYKEITLSQWIDNMISSTDSGDTYDSTIAVIEQELISKTLKKFKNNKFKTAQFLGINRNTLRHKMELYHL